MIELIQTYLIVSLIVYFFPFLLSLLTGNRIGAVFVMNFFLGWTLIGWIWALVWAVTPESKSISNKILMKDYNAVKIMQAARSNNQALVKTENSFETNNLNKVEQLEILKSHEDKISQLQQLKQLFDSGVFTHEEFDQQKCKILES